MLESIPPLLRDRKFPPQVEGGAKNSYLRQKDIPLTLQSIYLLIKSIFWKSLSPEASGMQVLKMLDTVSLSQASSITPPSGWPRQQQTSPRCLQLALMLQTPPVWPSSLRMWQPAAQSPSAPQWCCPRVSWTFFSGTLKMKSSLR